MEEPDSVIELTTTLPPALTAQLRASLLARNARKFSRGCLTLLALPVGLSLVLLVASNGTPGRAAVGVQSVLAAVSTVVLSYVGLRWVIPLLGPPQARLHEARPRLRFTPSGFTVTNESGDEVSIAWGVIGAIEPVGTGLVFFDKVGTQAWVVQAADLPPGAADRIRRWWEARTLPDPVVESTALELPRRPSGALARALGRNASGPGRYLPWVTVGALLTFLATGSVDSAQGVGGVVAVLVVLATTVAISVRVWRARGQARDRVALGDADLTLYSPGIRARLSLSSLSAVAPGADEWCLRGRGHHLPAFPLSELSAEQRAALDRALRALVSRRPRGVAEPLPGSRLTQFAAVAWAVTPSALASLGLLLAGALSTVAVRLLPAIQTWLSLVGAVLLIVAVPLTGAVLVWALLTTWTHPLGRSAHQLACDAQGIHIWRDDLHIFLRWPDVARARWRGSSLLLQTVPFGPVALPATALRPWPRQTIDAWLSTGDD